MGATRVRSLAGLALGVMLTSVLAVPSATPAGAAAAPEISVGDVVVPEGDIGFATARLTVTLSQPVVADAFVTFATSAAGAMPGDDYVERQGRVRLRAGKVFATITVKVLADTTIEGDESVTVTILDAGAVAIVDPLGTVTIRDDEDQPAGRIAIGDASAREGDTAHRFLRFPVTIDRPALTDITARYQVAVGSASTTDLVVRSGTLRIRAGRTQGVVAVKVFGDLVVEGDEQLTVVLSAPVGTTLGDASGTGTIVDDDAPTVTTPDAPTITALVAGPGNGALTVTWSPSGDGGSAILGYDLEVDRPGGVIVGPYASTVTGATVTCGSPGVTCTLRVRARNAVGDGPWSAPTSATTFRAPGEVGDLVAHGGNGSISTTWSVPIDPGDYEILDYRVERSDDGDTFTLVGLVDVRTATVACPGERTTCWVRIRARNAAGYGPPTTISAVTWARPGAPTLVSIRRIGDLVGLTWEPPADDGGAAIIDYRGERSLDGGTTWSPVGSVALVTPTCPIGTSCQFRVRARNVVGDSDLSNVLTVGP